MNMDVKIESSGAITATPGGRSLIPNSTAGTSPKA